MLGKLLIRDRMATQKRKRKKKYPPGLKNRKRLTMSPNQFLLLIGGQRLQKIPRILLENLDMHRVIRYRSEKVLKTRDQKQQKTHHCHPINLDLIG